MANRPSDNVSSDGSQSKDEWTPYRNILSLLHIGFSFDDIKHLTMSDFIAFTDLEAAGADEIKTQDEDTVRNATQADIDALFR